MNRTICLTTQERAQDSADHSRTWGGGGQEGEEGGGGGGGGE